MLVLGWLGDESSLGGGKRACSREEEEEEAVEDAYDSENPSWPHKSYLLTMINGWVSLW